MQIISQYFNRYFPPAQKEPEPFDMYEFESEVMLSLPLDTLNQPEELEKILKERLDEKMKELASQKIQPDKK